MKQPINRFAATTLTAAVLSMSLASAAFAAEPTMLAANDTVDKAEQAVSDTWITSKVKSTFVADSNLSALDIKVETNQGVVSCPAWSLPTPSVIWLSPRPRKSRVCVTCPPMP